MRNRIQYYVGPAVILYTKWNTLAKQPPFVMNGKPAPTKEKAFVKMYGWTQEEINTQNNT